MKKLCFLTAGILPVPVTEGGAVESLVQIMLENNEVLKKQPFELHVISKYTPRAVQSRLSAKHISCFPRPPATA